jgi:chemotaxis protein MotB
MPYNVSRITAAGRAPGERVPRFDLEELNSEFEAEQTVLNDNGWAVGYLDILLLLLTLFAVLLAIAYMQKGDAPALPNEIELTLQMPLHKTLPEFDPGLMLNAYQTAAQQKPQVAVPIPLTAPPKVNLVASSPPPEVRPVMPPLPPALARVAALLTSQHGEPFDLLVDKRQIRLEMREDILFSPASAELGSAGQTLLDQLASSIEREDFDIIVEGHTDDVPIATRRFPSNWELSSYRATTVARYLIDRGIDNHRVQVVGYADTRPLLPNTSRENRASNRRVSVLLRLPESHGDGLPAAEISPLDGSGIADL